MTSNPTQSLLGSTVGRCLARQKSALSIVIMDIANGCREIPANSGRGPAPTVIPAKAGPQKSARRNSAPHATESRHGAPSPMAIDVAFAKVDDLSRLKPLPRAAAGSVGATLVAIFLCRPQWPVTPAFSGPRATLTATKVLCYRRTHSENASTARLTILRRVRLTTKCAHDPHNSLTLSRPGQ